MLNFIELSARNVGPYEQFRVPLQNQGVVFIYGKNGAGKSFIWEVLSHVLFGTCARELKKDAFVRGKNMWAAVKFRHDDGPEIEICQFRQHETAKYRDIKYSGNGYLIFQDATNITPVGGVPACEKLVRKLVGMTEIEFNSCTYMSQSFRHRILKGTPTDRFHFISSLFRLDQYDEVLVRLKDASSYVQRILDNRRNLNAVLTALNEQLTALGVDDARESVDLDADIQRVQQELNYQNDVQRKLYMKNSVQDSLSKLPSRVALEFTSAQVQEGVLGIQGLLATSRAQDQIKQQLSRVNGPTSPDEPRLLKEKLLELEERQKQFYSYVEWERRHSDVSAALSHAESMLAGKEPGEDPTPELEECRAKLFSVQSDINSLSSAVSLGSVCPTCKQPISNYESTQAALDAKKAEKEALSVRLPQLVSQVGEYRRCVELTNQIANLRNELSGLGNRYRVEDPSNEKAAVQNRLSELSSWTALNAQIDYTFAHTTEDLTKQLENQIEWLKYTQATEKANQERDRLEAQLAGIDVPENFQAKDTNALQATLAEMNKRQGELEQRARQRDKLREDIATNEKSLETTDSAVEVEPLIKVLLDAYGTRGLKRIRISRIAAAISENLNAIVKMLFNDPNWKFLVPTGDGTLDLLIERKYGCYEARFLSGGEERRANLGLLLCLYELASPGKKTNLIVLDEFVTNVDEEGEDRMVQETIPLVRSMNIGSVFFIDNRESVPATMVDQIWSVEFDGVKSTLNTRKGEGYISANSNAQEAQTSV